MSTTGDDNVDQKSPPDNWVAMHDAAMDALVRGAVREPARVPYDPYPGDHPCEIKGCANNAPFGIAALPRRVWFCKDHVEEITCLMSLTRSTSPDTKNSRRRAA